MSGTIDILLASSPYVGRSHQVGRSLCVLLVECKRSLVFGAQTSKKNYRREGNGIEKGSGHDGGEWRYHSAPNDPLRTSDKPSPLHATASSLAVETKMSSAATRLTKELGEVGKDDGTSGVKAVPVNPDNPRILVGTIKGPEGTAYEGGVFSIKITIPKQYPFEPPKMKFDTKIWHPNISSQTGAICLVRTFMLSLEEQRLSIYPTSPPVDDTWIALCSLLFMFLATNHRTY